jgi:hypothetical protein
LQAFLCTMRSLERFLIMLAVFSLGVHVWGAKDGAVLELIAFPALALFYIVCTVFLLLPRSAGTRKHSWLALAIASGLVIAYGILSAMCFTLGWISRADMLVNCIVFLGLLIATAFIGYRKTRASFYKGLLLRSTILLAAVLLISLLPSLHSNPVR